MNIVKGFDDELVAAGVPSGMPRPDYGEHLDIRVYPQIKPIVIDWIRTFRTRLSPGMRWQRIKWSFQGIAKSSGHQPELVAALVEEFRNLLEVDFREVTREDEDDAEYKSLFLENFSLAIAFSAGPADYDRLKELVLDRNANFYSWTLMREYFLESNNDDLASFVGETIHSAVMIPAATIAGRHGFTQFLPEVRRFVVGNGNDLECYADENWADDLEIALYELEKKDYADAHADSSIDEIVRDLDREAVAPYAAHLLGTRKDRRAFAPLQAKASPMLGMREPRPQMCALWLKESRLSYRIHKEINRALYDIDVNDRNSGVDWLGGEMPDAHQSPPEPRTDETLRGGVTGRSRHEVFAPLDSFFEDLLAAGLPSAGARSNRDEYIHPDMRVYPQIEPVLIDWIGNFRTRLGREIIWPLFLWKIHGIAIASGEQPGLVRALLAEFWTLVDLDFTEFEVPAQYDDDPVMFKWDFVQCFCVPIVCAASPANYLELRKIVFDEKSRKYCLFLIRDYFGVSDNDDVPTVLMEALKVPDPVVHDAVAHVAAARGLTQFLPHVRGLEKHPSSVEFGDEWVNRVKNDIDTLERLNYVEINGNSSTKDIIRDLKRADVAPHAAYVLGQRKDPSALRALKRKMRSPDSVLEHEAAAAVKAITE